MGLAASEREVFEAQLCWTRAVRTTQRCVPTAPCWEPRSALTREKNPNLGEEADEIVREFRKHLVDTNLFSDPYAGGKFAHFLLRTHRDGINGVSEEAAHQLIEEAQLFVDAAHQCYSRLSGALA